MLAFCEHCGQNPWLKVDLEKVSSFLFLIWNVHSTPYLRRKSSGLEWEDAGNQACVVSAVMTDPCRPPTPASLSCGLVIWKTEEIGLGDLQDGFHLRVLWTGGFPKYSGGAAQGINDASSRRLLAEDMFPFDKSFHLNLKKQILFRIREKKVSGAVWIYISNWTRGTPGSWSA